MTRGKAVAMTRLQRLVASVVAAFLLVLSVPGVALADSVTGGADGVWSFKWASGNAAMPSSDSPTKVAISGSYGLPCCGNGAGWNVQVRLIAECDSGGYVTDDVEELPVQNALTFYFDNGAQIDANVCGSAFGAGATYVRFDFRTWCVVVCDPGPYVSILQEGVQRCPWDGRSASGVQGCNVGDSVGDSLSFDGSLGPFGSYGWGQAVKDSSVKCGTLGVSSCHRVVTFHAQIPAADCAGPLPADPANGTESVSGVPSQLVVEIDGGGYPSTRPGGNSYGLGLFVGSGINVDTLTNYSASAYPYQMNDQAHWPLATATDTTISADFLVDLAVFDGVDGPWKTHTADLYCRREVVASKDTAMNPSCDSPPGAEVFGAYIQCWEGEAMGAHPTYDFLASTSFSYVAAAQAVAGCGFSVADPSTWGDAAQCQAVVELQQIKAELGGIGFNTGTNGSGGGTGGGGSGPPPSSDGTNWWDVIKALIQGISDFLKGMTDLAKSLFVPSQSSLDALGTLRTSFTTHPPGSLLTAGSSAVDAFGSALSSSCESIPSISLGPVLGGLSVALPSLCSGSDVVGVQGSALWHGAYQLLTVAIYVTMGFGLWRMASGAFGGRE